MKGWSPFTQKTHPKHSVTPPSKIQSEKSEGTIKPTSLISHGTFDRPKTIASLKEEWTNVGGKISKGVKKIEKYIKGKLKE